MFITTHQTIQLTPQRVFQSQSHLLREEEKPDKLNSDLYFLDEEVRLNIMFFNYFNKLYK